MGAVSESSVGLHVGGRPPRRQRLWTRAGQRGGGQGQAMQPGAESLLVELTRRLSARNLEARGPMIGAEGEAASGDEGVDRQGGSGDRSEGDFDFVEGSERSDERRTYAPAATEHVGRPHIETSGRAASPILLAPDIPFQYVGKKAPSNTSFGMGNLFSEMRAKASAKDKRVSALVESGDAANK